MKRWATPFAMACLVFALFMNMLRIHDLEKALKDSDEMFDKCIASFKAVTARTLELTRELAKRGIYPEEK